MRIDITTNPHNKIHMRFRGIPVKAPSPRQLVINKNNEFRLRGLNFMDHVVLHLKGKWLLLHQGVHIDIPSGGPPPRVKENFGFRSEYSNLVLTRRVVSNVIRYRPPF